MAESGSVQSHTSILQMIDWRLAQMQQGFVLHAAGIRTQMDERFGSLEGAIGRFCSEVEKVKEVVVTNTEEIKELKEDKCSLTERIEQMERKLEAAELNM